MSDIVCMPQMARQQAGHRMGISVRHVQRLVSGGDLVAIGDNRIDAASVAQWRYSSREAGHGMTEGRQLLVHCHGGASRTGLVLRAWLMRTEGMTPDEAAAHVAERWPHLGFWNASFTAALQRLG